MCFLLCLILCQSLDELRLREVPAPLLPWVAWALHGEQSSFCPRPYDHPESPICLWPSELSCRLDEQGGSFRLEVAIFAEQDVFLPGEQGQWPQRVSLNGRPLAVVERSGRPTVQLGPGNYRLEGAFSWPRLPQQLALPPELGRVSIELQGRQLPAANRDGNSFWLEPPREEQTDGNALEVQIFRLLHDEIPATLEVLIRLSVSGENRDWPLQGALPEGFFIHQYQSDLPWRQDATGSISANLRPGQWWIRLHALHPARLERLRWGVRSESWPQEEFLCLAENHRLRYIQLPDITAIDPSQTTVPEEWRAFPCYLHGAGQEIQLKELARGVTRDTRDELAVSRTLWLHHDASTITVRDQINGTLNRSWRMTLEPPFQLERFAAAGTDQLITLDGAGRGVEMRSRGVQVVAEAQGRWRSTMPALGWNFDAQSVQTSLILPPGFSLFYASGLDYAESWIHSWTLFTLFLVLLFSSAMLASCGRLPAFMLALFLVLSHRLEEPRWSWVFLLATMALAHYLPGGWLQKSARLLRASAWAILLFFALGFFYAQILFALFPHHPGFADYGAPAGWGGTVALPQSPLSAQFEGAIGMSSDYSQNADRKEVKKALNSTNLLLKVDPSANVQTGNGLPDWSWRSFDLRFHGPVSKQHRIGLVILPPMLNRLLALGRCVLLLWLLLHLRRQPLGFGRGRGPLGGMAGEPPAGRAEVPPSQAADASSAPASENRVLRSFGRFLLPGPLRGGATWLVPLLAVLGSSLQGQSAMPAPELLAQLKERLLRQEECGSRCAEMARMHLSLSGSQWSFDLEIHAQARVGVPLPGKMPLWTPRAISLDGRPPAGLRSDDSGTLWLLVEAGVNRVQVQGTLPDLASAMLEFPLPPRHLTWELSGWQSSHTPGQAAPSQVLLQALQRASTSEEGGKLATQNFAQVERNLSLELDWRLSTVVTRMGAYDLPWVVSVPLLPGEQVLSSGMTVQAGQVELQFAAGEQTRSWESRLEPRDRLDLQAAEQTGFSESWQITPTEMWHVTWQGIEPIVQVDERDVWAPRWQPWQGETVSWLISRPPAYAGRSLTIDRGELTLELGSRTASLSYEFDARASRGESMSLTLPAALEDLQLLREGEEVPFRMEERNLLLHLTPGAQQFELKGSLPGSIPTVFRFPAISQSQPLINQHVRVTVPGSRWVLATWGGDRGPIGLFWPLVVFLVLLGWALARSGLTPLKARDWTLLGLGASQLHPITLLPLFGWLLLLGAKRHWLHLRSRFLYNSAQLLLIAVSCLGFILLLISIRQGLLGSPNMQWVSSAQRMGRGLELLWYEEASSGNLPRPGLFSLSIWFYRAVMLAWSFWLAREAVRWARWMFEEFLQGGAWRRKATLPPA